MAEAADRDPVRDLDTWAEEDVRADRHVAAEARVVAEPDRLGGEQGRPFGHGARAQVLLQRRLGESEIRARVDADELLLGCLDIGTGQTLLARECHDRGQVIFALGVAPIDPREEGEGVPAVDRHDARVAECQPSLGGACVLHLDDRLEGALFAGDEAGIAARVRGAEAEHGDGRLRLLPARCQQALEGGFGDEGRVAEEHQHVAREAREQCPCREYRVAGAEGLGLHDRGVRLDRVRNGSHAGADHDHAHARPEPLDRRQEVPDHGQARELVQHLGPGRAHAAPLSGCKHHGGDIGLGHCAPIR